MSITFNTDTVAAILNTDALKQRADDVAVSAVNNKVAGQALAENNRCISANQNIVVAKDSGTIVAYLTFGAASTHPKLAQLPDSPSPVVFTVTFKFAPLLQPAETVKLQQNVHPQFPGSPQAQQVS